MFFKGSHFLRLLFLYNKTKNGKNVINRGQFLEKERAFMKYVTDEKILITTYNLEFNKQKILKYYSIIIIGDVYETD